MELRNYLDVKPEVLEEAEKILRANLLSSFEIPQTAGCDLFQTLRRLKKFAPKDYPVFKDDILNRVTPKVSVEIKDLSLS